MNLPDAAPARPARPAVVTVAFWVQLAAVVVLLGLIGLVVAEAIRFDGQIDRALRLVPGADPMEVSDERASNIFAAASIGVPALLLAGWLAATALPVRRGGNVARILVFVAGGAQLLLCLAQGCSGMFLIPLMLAAGAGDPGFDPSTDVPPDGAGWPESKFLETLYSQGDPPDVVFAIGGFGVLVVLALTATVVLLLALPPASRYFRPRSAAPAGAAPLVLGYGYPPPGATIPYGYPSPGMTVPQGQPWPGVTVPPGYLLCPDPALHLAHPPTGLQASTPDDPSAAVGDVPPPASRTPEAPAKPPADPTIGSL